MPWDFNNPEQSTDGSPTWTDYLKDLGIGTADLAASLPAGTRYLTEGSDNPAAMVINGASRYLQGQLNDAGEDTTKSLTPAAQERLSASLGSEEFWNHPFSAALLKTFNGVPAIAATVASTVLTGGGAAGLLAMGATGGTISAGQVLDDINKQVDNTPDADLQKASTLYAGYRSMGLDEQAARSKLDQTMEGYKPAIAFALGAAANVAGAPGQIARAAGKGVGAAAATGGLISRVGKEAGQGALAGAAQAGGNTLLTEQAAVDAMTKPSIDYGAVANSAAEGGMIGGALGGVAGIHSSEAHTTAAVPRPLRAAEPTETIPAPGGPNMPAHGGDTQSSPALVPNAPHTPAVATVPGAKGAKYKKGKTTQPTLEAAAPVVTPDPITPSPEEAVALAAAKPEPTPAAPQQPAPVAPAAPEPVRPPEPSPVPQTPGAGFGKGTVAARVESAPEPTPVAQTPDVQPAEGFGKGTVAVKPRVLPDLTAQADQSRAATEEHNSQVLQNIADMKKAEAGPQGKNRTKAELEQRANDEAAATKLFSERVPVEDKIPASATERAALHGRLNGILKDAEAAGVKIPVKVTSKTPDAIVWLREVKDLAGRMAKKSFVGTKANEHITTFLMRERAAKGGDFSIMRSERSSEGEAASRGQQKNVETIAAAPVEAAPANVEVPSNFEGKPNEHVVGKDDVATSVVPSKRRVTIDDKTETKSVKGLGEVPVAKAASEVRKVALTPELLAKYNKPAAPKAEAKITPKVAEVKAKVEAKTPKTEPKPEPKPTIAAEAKKVDRNPTEAQKEAGNYAKGHVSVHGIEVTIENPKGAERTGTGKDGSKWSVRMPAHYGYIKRTEGADGDHVDAYIGPKPDSDVVVIVDQVDPDTRKFDEHKVLLGFSNVRAALETYDSAFNDGRGAERVGDFRVQTVAEFKEWLKHDTTKPAGVVDNFVTAEPNAQAHKLPSFFRRRPAGHSPESFREAADRLRDFVEANHTEKANLADILPLATDAIKAENNGTSVTGQLARALFPRFAERIANVAGGVPVYIVPDEFYLGGVTNFQDSLALYDPVMGGIVVRASTANDRGTFAHTILHEGVHAALMKATYEAAPHVRGLLENVLEEARLAGALNDFEGEYGLTNIDELLAEAVSNPAFQEKLAGVEASPKLIAKLGLGGRIKSLWDIFVATAARILGLPNTHTSLLAATLKLANRLEMGAPLFDGPASDSFIRSYVKHNGAHPSHLKANDVLPERFKQPDRQEQMGAPRLLSLRTADQVAQLSKDYSAKFGAAVRKVVDSVERIRVRGEHFFQEWSPTIIKLHALEMKYAGTEHWTNFATLVHDETMSSVYADRPLADQAHLGKDTLHGSWAKKQHPRLAELYSTLPEDLKAMRLEGLKFFADKQNLVSFARMKNVMGVLGHDDPALADRIFSGNETDADKALLGHDYELITNAQALAKIKGPYFPLMRHGNFVTRARYKLTPPTNALRQIDPNTWEFSGKGAREQALAYGDKQETRPTVSSVWVDSATGERYFTDLATGKEVPVHQNDVNSEQRFRVHVQDRHVEFFESRREADQAASALEKSGLQVDDVAPRKFSPNDRQADLMSHQMQTLVSSLERREAFRGMSPRQQNELIQGLNEASLRLLGSTRVQTRNLPRYYVEGASRDITKNTVTYAKSVSGYLARLELQPELDAAAKSMHEEMNNNADSSKRTGFGKTAIANEIDKRLKTASAFEETTKFGENVNRVLILSFLDKLVSPAHNIVNALQVGMVTYPGLAAKYGPGRAASMLLHAYSDISAFKVAKDGLVSTKNKLLKGSNADVPSLFNDVKARISNADERSMLDRLVELGSIDPDAGIEVNSLVESRHGIEGKIDQGLSYFQGWGRQMPRAIETINRSVSALAAYRLELARTHDHEAAVQFAQETVNLTQGNYSHTNAAPIFNHPLGHLTLQFKKYGQLIYGLIGHQIGRAIRNANEGDRAEAIKTLAYMAGTHVFIAGALGLPTEPFKWLVIGANQAGVTDLTWADVENYERELASSMFGQQVGEVVSRGVTRALPAGFAFDLSSRAGLNDLMSFGEPRSTDTQDVYAYMGQLIGGAPFSLATDWLAGSKALMSGDVTQAAEKLVPLKFAADLIKAARITSEGKKTAAGYQAMEPYSAGQAVVRGLGFTPGGEAETSEERNYFYSAQKRAAADRNDLLHSWANANSQDRGRLWGQVEKFNYGKDSGARLTRSDLDRYAKGRRTEIQHGTVQSGFKVGKTDKKLFSDVENTYNTQ